MGFDVAPPIGVASRSRDNVFHWEMKNIKKDTFISGHGNKNVNRRVFQSKNRKLVNQIIFILFVCIVINVSFIKICDIYS